MLRSCYLQYLQYLNSCELPEPVCFQRASFMFSKKIKIRRQSNGTNFIDTIAGA